MTHRHLVFAFFFLGSILQAQTIEKTLVFKNPVLQQKGDEQVLTLDETRLHGRPGEPLLPYRSVRLALPPGQTLDRLEIIPGPRITLPGSFRIAPAQPDRQFSNIGPQDHMKKETVYTSKTPYPQTTTPQGQVHYLHGVAFVLATVTPASYVPASGELGYSETVTLRVHTRPAMNKAPFTDHLPASNALRNMISGFAQNPELLKSYPMAAPDADDYPLLIVTSQAFAQGMEALVAFYQARGLKAQIMTQEDIEATYSGVDPQEQLRNAIRGEVTDHGVEMVLLAGDAEVIPYRPFYAAAYSGGWTYANIPSDLYYSALDGTWDDNGDGVYGQPEEADLLPEIGVGRLPISNQTDLANMLHKIMQYQDHPVTGELRNLLLAGEKMWDNPKTWSADFLDLLVGDHEDNGYTSSGIPENYPIRKLYDHDMIPNEWTVPDLLSQIGQGGTAVYHSGHSNVLYNMRMNTSAINNTNFATLDGVTHNYVLVNTQGCSPGAFDSQDSIGEKMVTLETFAVAFVGASRSGWFNEGQTDGPAIHLAREFVDGLYGQGLGHLGLCHMHSQLETAPWVDPPNEHEPGATRWNFYGLTVLGDPALVLWTDEPAALTLNHTGMTPKPNAAHRFWVQRNGQPASGCVVALLDNDNIVAYGRTNEQGEAQIRGDIADGTYQAIVSGYNGQTLHTSVQIVDTHVADNGSLRPTSPRLESNYPNPFNPETRMGVTLPQTGKMVLEIYDVTGRRVRTLVNAIREAGRQIEIWDGRDDQGNPVASGLYIARLSTPQGEDTLKMTLLR